MPTYLFQIELPVLTDEMLDKMPVHREMINELFAQGKMLSYSVSIHRTLIWCVINAEDEPQAMAIVLQFPLYEYFTDVVCHPLLFHNTIPAAMPGIFLN